MIIARLHCNSGNSARVVVMGNPDDMPFEDFGLIPQERHRVIRILVSPKAGNKYLVSLGYLHCTIYHVWLESVGRGIQYNPVSR